MSNPTIRISQKAHTTLKELAARSGQAMQDILDHAVEEERRRRFILEANSSYTRLQENTEQWSALKKERDLWDQTLMDGIDAGDTAESKAERRTKPAKSKKDGKGS